MQNRNVMFSVSLCFSHLRKKTEVHNPCDICDFLQIDQHIKKSVIYEVKLDDYETTELEVNNFPFRILGAK